MSSGYLYIAICIAFTVIGQLLMKWGMIRIGSSPQERYEIPAFVLRALVEPGVILGLACAVMAAVSWMLALSSKLPLSVAYPFMSLAIVLVLLLSPLCFDEIVGWNQWIGLTLVVTGLWLASMK
jgi:multidrug transporter EmrE-like cation transporter